MAKLKIKRAVSFVMATVLSLPFGSYYIKEMARQKIQATHPELGCLTEYRRNRKKMQKLYTDYARK